MSDPVITIGHVQEVTRPTWKVGEKTFDVEHLAHRYVVTTYIEKLLEEHAEMGLINVSHAADIIVRYSPIISAAILRYETARKAAGVSE